MLVINACGKACPKPVLMAKEAADKGYKQFTIVVDNETSMQNVLRFAQNAGFNTNIEKESGIFKIICEDGSTEHQAKAATTALPGSNPYRESQNIKSLFILTDTLGRGSEELGRRLMAQLLSTLAVNEARPQTIVLMNAGVKLACLYQETIDALQDLEKQGVEILSCGTCLNYFDLNNKLKVGRPTNAYEALNLLLQGNTVTWG
ncbi:MAG: sulfurtransferase-like selenium metabolism protein YedF [Peptococcaceae bacterium]|nr:sulfurtransferase-like selenium metabolism protein YedF [Peptococcaceae bacterium]